MRWWNAIERPRKIMLIAIALMFLSQFGDYAAAYTEQTLMPIGGGGGGDYAQPDISTGFAIAHVTNQVPGERGWTMHPHAWLVLAALAVLFGFGLSLGPWWALWRYRIAVIGLVLCFLPYDVARSPGLGFVVGLGAIALGVWALRVNGKPAIAVTA